MERFCSVVLVSALFSMISIVNGKDETAIKRMDKRSSHLLQILHRRTRGLICTNTMICDDCVCQGNDCCDMECCICKCPNFEDCPARCTELPNSYVVPIPQLPYIDLSQETGIDGQTIDQGGQVLENGIEDESQMTNQEQPLQINGVEGNEQMINREGEGLNNGLQNQGRREMGNGLGTGNQIVRQGQPVVNGQEEEEIV